MFFLSTTIVYLSERIVSLSLEERGKCGLSFCKYIRDLGENNESQEEEIAGTTNGQRNTVDIPPLVGHIRSV